MVINSDTTLYGREPAKSSVFDITRKGPKPYGIAFPLTTKGYLKKVSGIELIKNNLRQLLLTNRGERVMLPDFGTNLREYLMEPMDQALFSQIKEEILESIYKYARNVNVTRLQIFPGDTANNSMGQGVSIILYCELIEQDSISFEIKVDLI